MIGVLHHIAEPDKILEMLKNYLSDGGVVVVNEPQKGNPFISLMRRIRKKKDKNYSSDQVEFSLKELREIFQRSGFSTDIYSQGVYSTPFAETTFLPKFIGYPLSFFARILDPVIEFFFLRGPFRFLSWNLVVIGKKVG